jgi:hypothetical protein
MKFRTLSVMGRPGGSVTYANLGKQAAHPPPEVGLVETKSFPHAEPFYSAEP